MTLGLLLLRAHCYRADWILRMRAARYGKQRERAGGEVQLFTWPSRQLGSCKRSGAPFPALAPPLWKRRKRGRDGTPGLQFFGVQPPRLLCNTGSQKSFQAQEEHGSCGHRVRPLRPPRRALTARLGRDSPERGCVVRRRGVPLYVGSGQPGSAAAR